MPPRLEFPFRRIPRRIFVPQLLRPSFRPQTASFHQCRRLSAPADADDAPLSSKTQQPSQDGTKVRFFEQDPDSDAKPQWVSDDTHPEALERDQFLDEIHSIEDRMKKYESDMMTGEYMLEGLSEEDRMEVINSLRERQEEFKELAITVLDPEFPKDEIPLLKRLNRVLRILAINEDKDKSRKDLWKLYLAAREYPDILSAIPETAWSLIWRTQTNVSSSNPDGAARAKTIAADMERAGKQPTLDQRVARIEALFVEDDQDRAFREWEEGFRVAGGKYGEKITPNYLDIGIRMFAETGNVARARQLLRQLFETHPNEGLRSAIPVLAVHVLLSQGEEQGAQADSQENIHLQQAWALYQFLRSRFASAMTMEDYDAIYVCYLQANLRDSALAVFRDMMLSGQEGTTLATDEPPRQLVELQALSDDAAFFNKVNLTGLGTLPQRMLNKFFFASWAKKLIGMGELHAAGQVFELMWERKIPPDAIHLNGLIAGWLRSGDPDFVAKAEQMAWTMVGRRMEYGYRQRAASRGESVEPPPSISVTEDGFRLPEFLVRPVRMASRETFNLLLHHYLHERKPSLRAHVKNMVNASEIPLNSKFMNDVMWGCIYCGDPQEAWNEFKYWSKKIRPNMDTWICLGQALKDLIERKNYGVQHQALTPRSLFQAMEGWFAALPPEEAEKMAAYFRKHSETDESRVPYEQIIQPFCLTMDLPGTLVAMQRLRDLFGVYPDQRTARKLVLMVSRSKLPMERTPRRRRAVGELPHNRRNIERVSKILQTMFEEQQTSVQERGLDWESMDDLTRSQMNLDLFSRLIMVALKQAWQPEQISRGLEKARHEMCV